jgi:predicted phage-related endonuclease
MPSIEIQFKDYTAWIAARKKYICASEVPKLFGIFGSPLTLYASKKQDEETEQSIAMLWGQLDQGSIISVANKTTGLDIVPWPELLSVTNEIDGIPYLATPDATEWNTGALVECKSFEIMNDAKLDAARIQVQAQLMICEQERGYLLVRQGNKPLYIEEITASADTQKKIREKAKAFYECVKSSTPPAPLGLEEELTVLKDLFKPTEDKITVNIPEDLGYAYDHLLTMRKQIDSAIAKIECDIYYALGAASLGNAGNYLISRRRYAKRNACFVKSEHKSMLEKMGIPFTGGNESVVDYLQIKRKD